MSVVSTIHPLTFSPPSVSALPCRVAIVGFGTVGRSVARLIGDARSSDLTLTSICNRGVDRKRVAWVPDSVRWTESIHDTVRSPDVDVVVELMGGLEPAFTCIREALAAGKPVVTANKQVVGRHGAALFDLARQSGVELRCEAAAGGAVPIVRALAESLRADRVVRIAAVLNGTSNFVLERLARGAASLDDAVAEAQARGIAESDPAADLDGHDAAAKLALLSLFAFGAQIDPAAVSRESVRSIGRADFALARRLGFALKPVTYARTRGAAIEAWTGPAFVPLSSPLALVEGARNAIAVTGAHSGDTVLSGEGAGGDPTAVAVLSDVLSIAGRGSWRPPALTVVAAACQEPIVPHFVRLSLLNRIEGLPLAIACLHRHELRVRETVTLGTDARRTDVAIGLEPCRAAEVRAAVAAIQSSGVCTGTAAIVPVFSGSADGDQAR